MSVGEFDTVFDKKFVSGVFLSALFGFFDDIVFRHGRLVVTIGDVALGIGAEHSDLSHTDD